MEDQIKQAHELLKKCDKTPSEENAVALCKATMDIDAFESCAIMALALRIKPTAQENKPFRSILITIPEWIEWAYKYRGYIDGFDPEAQRARRDELVQELGLKV